MYGGCTQETSGNVRFSATVAPLPLAEIVVPEPLMEHSPVALVIEFADGRGMLCPESVISINP